MMTEKERYRTYKEQNKFYRLSHKEEIKAYYQANKERIRARCRVYRLKHKEQDNARSRAYQKKHPEINRARARKYRLLRNNGNYESYKDSYIFERDNWVCGICGRKINKRLKCPNPLSKSIDHIIPISKGGADAPINVQAAHFRCNNIKHARAGGQLRLIG